MAKPENLNKYKTEGTKKKKAAVQELLSAIINMPERSTERTGFKDVCKVLFLRAEK